MKVPKLTVSSWYGKAGLDAGKGFFGTLAATYVTGHTSLESSLVSAGILAGLAFFTRAEQPAAPTSEPTPPPAQPQTPTA